MGNNPQLSPKIKIAVHRAFTGQNLRFVVVDQIQDLKNANIAVRNVLDDLSLEKSKTEIAKAKDEAMLASIGEGLIAVDANGKIIIMNQVAEKLLGWRIAEAIGRFYDEVISLEDEKSTFVPPAERPLAKALASSTTTTTTTTTTARLYLLSKNKIKFPVAITVSPIVLDEKIIGAIEVFRDITKEKEIDKAKTEFVSLTSHQLRTPLTAISWYTEMILDGDVDNLSLEQKKYLNEISRGNRRMIDLVNTLLDVSRIELGALTFEPQPTDIIALAQSAIDEQKPEIEKKRLNVVQKFVQNVPVISIDPKLLRIVFQNLLSNSVMYTPVSGKIEFTISVDDLKTIQITVADTGYGIPKNQQKQIFAKLFRADNVRDKDTTGTGLGLYIIKSIVENAGGKIWFESPTNSDDKAVENPGTTFHVTLPLRHEP